ncbi:transcriptional regulator BetI [Oricola sp.]|uniref:transcriptional regulator BetI n=1 Tax=Oricola sp. TaxID=1979950 RepID=UPI003BAA619D
MPKYGMEPIRRSALIDATIREIGQVGSLEVTVGQIARRAGMSSALAHHYFGSKEQIFLAAMSRILTEFSEDVRARLKTRRDPLDRLEAIIEASFGPRQFDRDVVAAWLAFYVQAQNSPHASRLLRVYARRLDSNLVYNLRQLVDETPARRIAQSLASMIDGFYIRHALQDHVPDRLGTMELVREYLEIGLERERKR